MPLDPAQLQEAAKRHLWMHFTRMGAYATQDVPVIVRGEGIGTVVKVVEIRIAPANSNKDGKLAVNTVAGSLYGTNPPVDYYERCHEQVLKPVKGFVLRPQDGAHVWIVIRAVRPGTYNIPDHVVTYTDQGVLYRQVLTLRAYGSVADNARRPVLTWGEQQCIKPTRTTILSGFTDPAR